MSSATASTKSAAQTSGVASHSVLSKPQIKTAQSAARTATRTTTFARKLLKAITRHLPVKRRAPEPERLRRLAEIALMLGDRFLNRLLLQRFQIERGRLRRRARGREWHIVEPRRTLV